MSSQADKKAKIAAEKKRRAEITARRAEEKKRKEEAEKQAKKEQRKKERQEDERKAAALAASLEALRIEQEKQSQHLATIDPVQMFKEADPTQDRNPRTLPRSIVTGQVQDRLNVLEVSYKAEKEDIEVYYNNLRRTIHALMKKHDGYEPDAFDHELLKEAFIFDDNMDGSTSSSSDSDSE